MSFHALGLHKRILDAIDDAGDNKRENAELEGRVGKEIVRDDFLDLPEGEHAVEASIEVEFRGEVHDLSNNQSELLLGDQ